MYKRQVHILSETESRCKWSSQPKVLLEMAVVDICKPQMDSSLEGLIERVSMLEKRLEGKVLAQGAGSSRMPAEQTPADRGTPADRETPAEGVQACLLYTSRCV